jgi:hypothetical protein
MVRPAADFTLGRRIDNDCLVLGDCHFLPRLMVPNRNEHLNYVTLYDSSVIEFNGYGIPDLHCDLPGLKMGVGNAALAVPLHKMFAVFCSDRFHGFSLYRNLSVLLHQFQAQQFQSQLLLTIAEVCGITPPILRCLKPC